MYLYEGRITLWRAENMDEAIGFSELDASTYALETNAMYLNVRIAGRRADKRRGDILTAS